MIRSGSPWNSPDISAMPAALSATGPKVSSDDDHAGGGEHAHAGEGDEVERELQVAAAEAEGGADGDGDGDDGVHRRLEARRGAREHGGGRAGAGRLGDLLHRARARCAVKYSVSRLTDLGEHEADDDGAEAAPADVRQLAAVGVVADVDEREQRRRRGP